MRLTVVDRELRGVKLKEMLGVSAGEEGHWITAPQVALWNGQVWDDEQQAVLNHVNAQTSYLSDHMM